MHTTHPFAPSFTHSATRPRVTHRRAPLSLASLIALAPAIGLTVVMILAASLIGPFILFALPFMLLFGCAIGPLHALVRGELR